VAKSTTLMEVTSLGTVLAEVGADLQLQLPQLINRASRRALWTNFRVIGPSAERDRRPEGDEFERVLAQLPLEWHEASRFALCSAMRRGEIARLRWSDLDRKEETIVCRQRKHPTTKRDMEVPLLLGAYPILLRQPHVEGEDRVFPINPAAWSAAWIRACKDAGVDDLHLHDLRHESISRLFEAGYEIQEVAAVSGHRTWTQLRRYTQLRPKDLKHGPAKSRALLKLAAQPLAA
jgi:integrase